MVVEKRKHQRLDITQNVKTKEGKIIKGKNVGMGGICLATEDKFKVDDVIDVEFHLPGNSNRFTAKAKVLWCEKSDKEYLTGLEFININVVR